jgi:aspartyl-tRNA(Asn)/glutamyl-tRNA(Gln) amidotransferase subunit A
MTIAEAAAAIRSKKISSRELTEEALKRIAQLNSQLNAFITVTADQALERAGAMDAELARGVDRGPLHGIPIAHKDLMMTRGVRTTAGSKLFENFVPSEDAEVVARLNDAGAVMAGKTGLHELAYGITSNNPHFGAIRNPCDVERIPGGSSGGSGAAVAAEMVFMATGTDTGGSIRIPSSFCGTVGLKPTYEGVSRRGVIPLSLTLDHIGPMTRTVRDCAVAYQAIARQPAGDVPGPTSEIAGVRVGVPENYYFDRVDPEVTAAVRGAVQTAAALGAKVVEIRVPNIDEINVVGRVLLLVEAVSNLGPHLARRGDFGSDVLALLDQGRLISGAEYADAQRLRRMQICEFSKLWSQVDCIFTPATPLPAPKIGQTSIEIAGVPDDVRLASTRFARAINVLGIPSLAMPCGFTKSGLPLGLQILGGPRQEDLLFRVGAALEDALALSARRPHLLRLGRPSFAAGPSEREPAGGLVRAQIVEFQVQEDLAGFDGFGRTQFQRTRKPCLILPADG